MLYEVLGIQSCKHILGKYRYAIAYVIEAKPRDLTLKSPSVPT